VTIKEPPFFAPSSVASLRDFKIQSFVYPNTKHHHQGPGSSNSCHDDGKTNRTSRGGWIALTTLSKVLFQRVESTIMGSRYGTSFSWQFLSITLNFGDNLMSLQRNERREIPVVSLASEPGSEVFFEI
jgi:hypothetical protein